MILYWQTTTEIKGVSPKHLFWELILKHMSCKKR